MISAICNGALRFRYYLLLLSLLLVAGSFLGFKNFVFDASPRSYFSDGYPHYERFLAVEETYGNDFVIFFMVSATDDGDVFNRSTLSAIEELTNQAWLLPDSVRVDSLSNFQYSRSENDEMLVESFFDKNDHLSDADIAQRKIYSLNEPNLKNRLVSADAKHAAVIASIAVDQTDAVRSAAIVEQAYKIAAELSQNYPNISVQLTGNIVSNHHTIQIAIRDISVMVPAMFLLMFIMLGTLMRTISGVIVSLAVASLAAVSAIAIAAGLGVTFSMLPMNAVIISITVAIAHCIHILNFFFHEYNGSNKAQALLQSLRGNFFPVSITSLTTAVGFLSLNFNDLPPAAALGNAAAIGTCLAWLFALTVLPALIMLLPFKVQQRDESLLENIMLKLADSVIRRKVFIVISSFALMFIMVFLSFQNRLNDRFSEMIHEPHIFRSDTAAIDEHFGALYNIHYDIDSGEEGGIASLEYLQNLDAFTEYLRQQPEISSVSSISDTIKRLNQNMHDDDPAYYRLPQSRELAAQFLLLYELSLPFGLDLNNQITMDKRRSRVVVTFPSVDTNTLLDMEQRLNQWQAENLPEQMRHAGGAMSVTWAHLSSDSLKHSMQGAIIALVLISGILLLVLRSVKYGLISLIPNLMPAAIGFGVWYFVSGEIGMGLTCVVIITIGIVVDDTVHFLSKYQQASKQFNGDAEAAIRYTFKHVGSALFITTSVLMSGFIVLTLSKIISNSSLGWVTAIILFAALMLDLLLLPALLLCVDKKKPIS